MPASLSKSEQRQAAIAQRNAIAPADHIHASQAVCERLREAIHSLPGPSPVVAAYCPIRAEVNVIHALSLLGEAGHVTALPRVEEAFRQLVFHRWTPGDALVKSAYAIDEPEATTEIVIPDIVIVPLLAFDRSGHRLGYGRGYYDITLNRLRAAKPALIAIGAAFSLQEVAALSPDAHDERLDMVVTEKEVLEVK